jgi:hypothetical protein
MGRSSSRVLCSREKKLLTNYNYLGNETSWSLSWKRIIVVKYGMTDREEIELLRRP